MKMPFNYRTEKFEKPDTYAVKHKDFNTRMASRSGGAFTALSDNVLNEEGIVYGCVLDENFSAIHLRAENTEMRNLMRGSKYIQSEMRDMFNSVKVDLENDKKVLFSGTSCQVAGLKGYLGKDYDNLFCVDIVCHGVPSPLVWHDYLKWQQEKNDSPIVSVDFRNKRDFGWNSCIETLFFENGKRVDSRVFTKMFYGNSILRPCCYKCPYKSIIHPGNITIADYWGIEVAAPGFNDNNGVSLVMINDHKGQIWFDQVKEDLEIQDTKIEDSMQTALKAPYNKPDNRKKMWDEYENLSFERMARKYGGYGFVAKVKKIIRGLIKRI